ncbi:hypothetical protein [Roseofilum sp. Belize Diploria]|uniref:hypothetical protein n=1 Tax=Roseofilum sp. Belize Diploria TaxID=2821501 RepID=UPI001B136384|nr:hypothetical protein [Roseofilum sp. Belize Diploria]MBP0010728.1 hypothetical protein [Roseofilum sp. Belize Diploria]
MALKRRYIAEVVGLLQSEGGRFFLQGFCKEYSKEEVFNIYLNSLDWIELLSTVSLYDKAKITQVDDGNFYLDEIIESARFVHSDYHVIKWDESEAPDQLIDPSIIQEVKKTGGGYSRQQTFYEVFQDRVKCFNECFNDEMKSGIEEKAKLLNVEPWEIIKTLLS